MFIKIGVETIPPPTLTAIRLVTAAAIMGVYVAIRGLRVPGIWGGWWRKWTPYVVIAIFGNAVPFTLIGWAEERIDSGLAAILIGTMPVFTLLLAHRFTRDERLTVRKVLGIALGLTAVIMLSGYEAIAGLGGHLLAQLAVIGAAMSYATASVYARRLARVSPLVITAASTIAAAVIMVPACLALDAPWLGSLAVSPPSIRSLLAALTLGVLSTAAAGVMFFYLLARSGAVFASQSNYLIPLFGVMWGFLFLGEHLSWNAAAALGFILGAIALIRDAGRGHPASSRKADSSP